MLPHYNPICVYPNTFQSARNFCLRYISHDCYIWLMSLCYFCLLFALNLVASQARGKVNEVRNGRPPWVDQQHSALHTRARARPVFITSLFPPSLVFVSRLTLQSLSPLNQRRNRNHKPHYVYHHQTSEQCDAAVKLWTYSGGTDFEPRPGYSYIHQVCIYRRCAQTFDQKQDWTDITASLPIVICLTFWRRNYFLNFSTPVYKIIIQEPNTLEF